MDYLSVAEQMIKDYNITIVENSTCWRRTHAHVDGTRRVCKWKKANSYPSLFLLLHEIGHIETHKSSMHRCEQESEATVWTIKKLRELGLPIKRKYTEKYKKYIKNTYNRGLARGLKKKLEYKLYL